MAKSILTDDWTRCFVDDCPCLTLQEHHLIEGRGRRNLSEKYGLKVPLCHVHHRWCHEEAYKHPVFAESMHMLGQLAFEKVHGSRQEFRKIFGEYFVNDEGL